MTTPTPYSAPAPVAKTNVLAIVALVTGIIGLAIVPAILGPISLSQIKKTGEQGKVMAIIGLVLGYLAILGIIIAIIVGIVFVANAGSISTSY